jgi:hypothetical protein
MLIWLSTAPIITTSWLSASSLAESPFGSYIVLLHPRSMFVVSRVTPPLCHLSFQALAAITTRREQHGCLWCHFDRRHVHGSASHVSESVGRCLECKEVRTSDLWTCPFCKICLMHSSSLEVPNSFSRVALEAPSNCPWAPCLFVSISVSFEAATDSGLCRLLMGDHDLEGVNDLSQGYA